MRHCGDTFSSSPLDHLAHPANLGHSEEKTVKTGDGIGSEEAGHPSAAPTECLFWLQVYRRGPVGSIELASSARPAMPD